MKHGMICVLLFLAVFVPGTSRATFDWQTAAPDNMTSEEIGEPLPSPVAVSGGAKVMFIYVVFPGEEPTYDYPGQAVVDSVSVGLTEHLYNQSGGLVDLDHTTVLNPGHPNGWWVADYPAATYNNATSVSGIARYESHWAFSHYLGELQAEILIKINAAYESRSLPNPFTDVAMIQFIYHGDAIEFGGSGVGGYGYNSVDKSTFDFLSVMRNDFMNVVPPRLPGCQEEDHGQSIWDLRWIVSHETGHFFSLWHSPNYGCDGYMLDPNSYFHGPYSIMRQVKIGGKGPTPFHQVDLIRLGWIQPTVMSSNRRGYVLGDMRLSRQVLKILIPGAAPQYLLLSYHGGNGIDANFGEDGTPICPSRGLAVWHVASGQWDLESAWGRFDDPAMPSDGSGYWTIANAVGGYDNLDVWKSLCGVPHGPPNDFSAYYDYFYNYPGSSKDFFGALSGKSEFSYRSNPNSFGQAGYYRRSPQSIPNSLVIKVLEERNDSVVLDILFAPYENVLTPNGGEVFQVGRPYAITWENEFTADQPNGIISTVDIYGTHGDGQPDQLIAAGVDATLGAYSWTPDVSAVGATCKIKIVYHNVNDANHVGEDESDAVFAVVVPNPIAENAAYRFRVGSTDTANVLAVTVDSTFTWQHVTADLSAVSGPASIELLDDGAGEDIKAGDGIFTSPRFAASMPTEGTYVASVTAEPTIGGPVAQSVNMTAIATAAKFKSDGDFVETERLGAALALGLSAKPYASVYFWEDTNNDTSDKVMITTFDDNSTAPGIWGRSSQFDGSEGPFVARGAVPNGWLSAALPAGSRGVCYADVDNDGDTDFFLCNPSQGGKLYINHLNDTSGPAEWQGKFIDQTSAFFGADASYLAGAITASWGDYTGDGFVDLFVATGMYVDPVGNLGELPAPACGVGGGDLRLFRNTLGTGFRKSLAWGGSGSPLCLAGCWLDLDGDGDLDLVTTRYTGAGFSVVENHGINAAHTDYVMEQVSWAPSVADIAANSITVIDYDHDAHLDLLVTECTSTRKQAWILRSNYGSGYSKSFTAKGFGEGQAWNGAVVADLNLDGQDDFVLLPQSADVVPALFMSTAYTPTPEFEDPWPAIQTNVEPGATHYIDLGYTLGIRDGMTGGGFAADLDGDHAPDLFLGREMVGDQGQSSGEQCLYRSTGTAATTNHWLQVKLRTHGDSNGALIGTTVSVVAGGKQWHKVVDGGSFRGGQGSNDLLFGLGSEASITEVKIAFPSGETHVVSEPYVDVNTSITIWEGNLDALTYGRPSSSYELQPGFVDWVFRWKSGTIKGDLRSDKVEVWPFGQPSNSFVLEYGMPNVSHAVYKESNVWVHELRWGGQQCSDGARWSFKVTSGAGSGGQTLTATQSASTSPVTYCIPENYGQ